MFLFSSLAGVAGALTLTAGSPALVTLPPVSVVSCDYNVLPAVSESLTPGTASIDVSNLQKSRS
jgi:multisubunit Na+/H+ antiporter MnhE subunit